MAEQGSVLRGDPRLDKLRWSRRLSLTSATEHFMQREHRIITRVIGVVTCRPISSLAIRIANSQIVCN